MNPLRNLQCSEGDTLQTRHPLWFTVRHSTLERNNSSSQRERTPSSLHEETLDRAVGRAIETFSSFQSKPIRWHIRLKSI